MESFMFVSEKKEYSIPEFHDRFHKCLPKIVEVNQGVCSETGEETFAKGEVIVIAAISRQKRIVTKIELNKKSRLLSIPETYGENLCPVIHGRPGKEDTLLNIIHHNKLPITVCFPRKRTITLKDKTISSNRIPHLTLTETFDEVYLLGNYINNGNICKEVMQVPLYLSQLRVSIVNGIKDRPVERWKHYKRKVNDDCALIKYDREFGNPDIAEYDPRAIHSGKALSYMEPMMYENIVNLVHTSDPQSVFPDMSPEEIDELGLYEDVHLDEVQKPKQGLYRNQPDLHHNKPDLHHNKPDTYHNKPDSHHNRPDLYHNKPNLHHDKPVLHHNKPANNKAFKEELVKITQSIPVAAFGQRREFPPSEIMKQRGPTRPPVAPKPTLKPNDHQEQSASPAVPARKQSLYQKTKLAAPPDNSTHGYSNLLPRSVVAPIQHSYSSLEQIKKDKTKDKKIRQVSSISRTISSKDDVVGLSVEEVCGYLQELNLNQYVDSFKDHMIDGAMLVELEPELLIEEIGMKKIEVARLMKFAREGHLPVRS